MTLHIYFFLGSLLFIISFIVVPIVAILDKSLGTIILVAFPSASFPNASKPFKVSTELSAPAFLISSIPLASASLIFNKA